MSVIPVCSDDPILTFIRKEYKATALNKPDERIQPLCVIAWDKNTSDFRGELVHLLKSQNAADLAGVQEFKVPTPTSSAPRPLNVPVNESTLPDQSVAKSKKVNTDIGFQLLGGFLSGLGIDVTPLKASFDTVRQVSFSFRNVKRFYLDKGQLGNELGQQKLNMKNIALSIFKNDPDKKFMLINSIITSSEFSVNIEKKGDTNFEVSTAILKVLKGLEGKLEINSVQNKELSFKGTKNLPFAFTCCELTVDWESGEFTGIGETTSDVAVPLSEISHDDTSIEQPLTKPNELLSFDN